MLSPLIDNSLLKKNLEIQMFEKAKKEGLKVIF